MVSEKRCRNSTCRKVKPASEFSVEERNRDGLASHCKECHREQSRQWKEKNRDKIEAYKPRQRENSQKWRDAHRELKRAESLAYYHERKNDPEFKAGRAEYRDTNRGKIRSWNNRKNREIKFKIIAAYGGQCFCCGETNPILLTLDHKNNDGAAWRKAYSKKHEGGYNLYRIVIELGFPDDLQLACWNCNAGRHFNGGTCPHEEERMKLAA